MALDNPLTDMTLDQAAAFLSRVISEVNRAMQQEGVPRETQVRVTNTLIFGSPEGLT